MKSVKFIELIEKYTALLTIVLYPVFFSTFFVNLFETPKLLVLFTSVFILTTTRLIKIFFKSSVSLSYSKFDIATILLSLAYLFSGIITINGVNKVDAFFYPGNGAFVVLSMLFYLHINQFKKEEKPLFVNSLLVSAFFVAITQIFSMLGILKVIPFLPQIIKTEVFTPTGNILSTIVFLAALLPISIYKLIKTDDLSEKILSSLVSLVFIISIVGSVYLILPGKESSARILDFKTGWSLATDSIKTNPILGVGPSNFNYVFNKFRPIEFNSGENWQIKYIQSSSLLLTFITEAGIAGLVALCYLIYSIAKNINKKSILFWSILVFVLGLALLPVSFSSIFILFVLFSLGTENKEQKRYEINKKQYTLFIIIPGLIALFAALVFVSRLFYAEYLFTNSIKNIENNDGLSAYNNINKAVSINRYSDRYHLLSSAINISLAESLSQKADLTDEDRNNISRLVQQSIREGKAAVAVSPYKSVNWEALSGIYQKLTPFANGSDVFAIQSLGQAISLDPINPILRIKLGNIYYSQEKYDLSIEALKLAVLSKPDLPNSHYNLAIVYKEAGQLDKAKEEMNTTLKLVGKESADYEKAMNELKSIEELTEPEKAPEPAIEPQIDIQEAEQDIETQEQE